MIRLQTRSMEATQAVAARVAEWCRGGDVILLSGDLGAGKTAFVRGFGAALGVDEPVTSPTFALVQRYAGRTLWINHLDVYRLDRTSEVEDLGLSELIDPDAVTLIEWGEAVRSLVGPSYLGIVVELGADDDDRQLTLQPVGAWRARGDALAGALEPWTSPC